MKHILTNYASGDAGYGRDEALGSLTLSDSKWRLRFWQSGGEMSGGLEATELAIGRRRPWSSEVVIRTADGSIRGSFCLPFCSAGRFRREVDSTMRALNAISKLKERSRSGEWWLDPEALIEVGPARTISVLGARYVTGWGDRVRAFRRSRPRIIDIDASGLAVRGARRRLAISWTEVAGLQIDAGATGRTQLTVRLRPDDPDVVFEAPRYSTAELDKKLQPVTQRMRLAESLATGD